MWVRNFDDLISPFMSKFISILHCMPWQAFMDLRQRVHYTFQSSKRQGR